MKKIFEEDFCVRGMRLNSGERPPEVRVVLNSVLVCVERGCSPNGSFSGEQPRISALLFQYVIPVHKECDVSGA